MHAADGAGDAGRQGEGGELIAKGRDALGFGHILAQRGHIQHPVAQRDTDGPWVTEVSSGPSRARAARSG